MIRFKFTKRSVEAIPVPSAGRTTSWDSDCKHLCVRTSASGSKAFYFYGKHLGRPVRVKIGDTDSTSPEEARKRGGGMELLHQIGTDPSAERRASRKEPTFGDLWNEWLERHAKPTLRSWRDTERLYKATLKSWAGRRLHTITRTEVAALHRRIGKDHGTTYANRVLAVVSCLYGKAETLVGWMGVNPALKIQRFKSNQRERIFSPEELQALLAAIVQEPSALWRAYWTTAVWTGCRGSSITSMRWQDLRLDVGLWTVPAEFSKNGRTLGVVLLPQVVDALLELKAESGANGTGWVFPSSRPGKGHVANAKITWKLLKARAGLTDPTLVAYSLRHSVASHLAMMGVALPIISACLGHASYGVTQRYAHLSTEPVRAALAAMSQRLLSTEGKTNGT